MPEIDPKPRPKALNAPWVKKAMKRIARAHVAVYRATDGRIGGTWRNGSAWKKPVPVALLDHVGRKSGRPYTTPLLHLLDGDDVIVVASSGGMDQAPQWFGNLMAHPETTVQIKAERRPVRARVATAAEAERLWPRLIDCYADFVSYQTWTDRELPVVILSPLASATTDT